MSYNHTVFCRYCREKGHNKRTCPKFKEWMKNNPDTYTTQRALEKEAKARQRACSYCHVDGHNKQTCPQLLKDKVSALTRNRKFREETLAFFKEKGIGLGTLLSFKTWYLNGMNQGQEVEGLFIVDEIRWNEVLYQGQGTCVLVNNHGERDFMNSFTVDNIRENLKIGRLVIEHPASEDNIGVGIPEDWEKGATNLRQAFVEWNDKL